MVQRRHLGFPTLTLILLLFPAAVATLLMLARMLSKHRQLQTIGWNNLDPSDAKTISSGFPNFDLHDFPVTNLDGRETHLRFMNIGEFILQRQKVHCLQKKHKRSVWSVCKFLLYHKTHQISREHQVGQRWKHKKKAFLGAHRTCRFQTAKLLWRQSEAGAGAMAIYGGGEMQCNAI